MNHSGRQQKTIEVMPRHKMDALLVTHLPNVRYLCGFTGSAGVLATYRGRWAFFTDGRYTTQAAEQVQGARVIIAKGPAIAAAAKWLERAHAKFIGIEAEHMTVAMSSALAKMLPRTSKICETRGLVERIRLIKEPEEVERIREAVILGAELLEAAMRVLRPGVSEAAVAAEIEYAARQAGASGMSFETIVASGPRSALPHGKASEALVPRNGFVVMDFGVILGGYCSDMTRTAHVGRVSKKERAIYDAVREAQQAGIDAVRGGVEAGRVDAAARKVLTRAGLGKYFTHSTGHGVGLEIHEAPRLGRGSEDVLDPGTIITIEPGAYVPGLGGVRIEDMVLVTESGCEVLTPASKELMIV